MLLSDMRHSGVSRKRSPGGDRARDRFSQVIGPLAGVRKSLAHAGLDVRMSSACPTRRGQCEFPGGAPRVLERRRRILVIHNSVGIVHTK